VIACLGEASHDAIIGMDFIVEDALLSAHADRPSIGLEPGNKSSPQQAAVDHILERSYFERVWVIQEILFAKEVQIILGDKCFDWAKFSRTVYYVNINKKILHLGVYEQLPRLLSYRDESKAFLSGRVNIGKPNSLFLLLRDTRTCKSTDPRHKIYALLGMSEEKDEMALAPNYDLKIEEVYSNLAKFFIDRDKRLDILGHVQGTQSKHDLLSWVPDWSFPYVCYILGHGKDELVGPYKASLERQANVFFEKDSNTLITEGKLFDQVSKVGPVYNADTETPFSSIQQWESMASTVTGSIDSSETFIDTTMAYAFSTPNPFRRWYSSWLRHTQDAQELSIHEKSEASIFQEQVSRACNGRCFFLIKKGHMGLGPEGIQEKDTVAILLGGSVPFVLREQETQFSLVGECYVHEAMRGEVIDDESLDLEIIRII
jgi:hypothetical protein